MKTFKDIAFLRNPYKNGWHGTVEVGEYTLSVLAADHAYSQPRAYLMRVEDYSKFEIAVLKNDEFVTREVFPNELDDVMAYQSREEIDDIIKEIEKHDTKQ